MKFLILRSFIIFSTGVVFGYVIWHTKPESITSNSSKPTVIQSFQIPPDEDHLKEIARLNEEISQLKSELVQKENTPSPDLIEKQIQKSFVQSIINGEKDPPGQVENDRKDFLKRIVGLNLTPEQMSMAELLWRKRMQQIRLRIQTHGFLSYSEQKEQYPELMEFSFDDELRKILSEKQISLYDDKLSQERENYGKVTVARFFTEYGFTDDSVFAESDRKAIESAISMIYSSNTKTDIPESIKELNLGSREKRILASCYNNLNKELFEKVYQRIVEEESITP